MTKRKLQLLPLNRVKTPTIMVSILITYLVVDRRYYENRENFLTFVPNAIRAHSPRVVHSLRLLRATGDPGSATKFVVR